MIHEISAINIITGNENGVFIEEGCEDTILTGNTIKDNTTTDIDDKGTNTQIGHNTTT